MPTAAAISAGGSLLGAGIGAWGSLAGSKQQSAALQQALALQEQMFGAANTALQPYIKAGQGALPTLQSLLTPGANQNAILSQLPGFQFAQQWGQRAVQNIGSTQGLGGNTLAGGAQYATGLAQQGFGNLAGLLQNFVNTGAQSGAALGGIASGFGQTIGNTLTGIGQAQAAGTLGATNSLAGALGGGANSLSTYMLLSRLFPGLASGAGAAGTVATPGIYSVGG
jgi:hypothetical protein